MSSGVATTDLLTRLLADATLEEAYAWLCTQRQDYSHNSDVWALRQHWPEVKDLIRREVAAGTYAFALVQVYHIDGETRDVWAARDAVVLKALAIVLGAYLTPRFTPYYLSSGGAWRHQGGATRSDGPPDLDQPRHALGYTELLRQH